MVKIKDVKTFIRAADITLKKYPESIFLVAGPYDEDEEYYAECVKVAKLLGIEENLKFLGKVNSKDFCNQIDIMVFTSFVSANRFFSSNPIPAIS